MQLQSWSPFLPTFFLSANFLPHIAFFLLWPTYLLGYNEILQYYVLPILTIYWYLCAVSTINYLMIVSIVPIRRYTRYSRKADEKWVFLHVLPSKNASVSFFVSISISLHIFLTFFMSFLVFIREDIKFRGCWQPYHIITVLKTSRVCFTSSFSYSLLCVHPFCYQHAGNEMPSKNALFFAHCGLVSNINSLLALQISKHFCNHPHR